MKLNKQQLHNVLNLYTIPPHSTPIHPFHHHRIYISHIRLCTFLLALWYTMRSCYCIEAIFWHINFQFTVQIELQFYSNKIPIKSLAEIAGKLCNKDILMCKVLGIFVLPTLSIIVFCDDDDHKVAIEAFEEWMHLGYTRILVITWLAGPLYACWTYNCRVVSQNNVSHCQCAVQNFELLLDSSIKVEGFHGIQNKLKVIKSLLKANTLAKTQVRYGVLWLHSRTVDVETSIKSSNAAQHFLASEI